MDLNEKGILMYDLKIHKKNIDEEKHKISKKDILAILIAQIEILAPIVIIFSISIGFIMFILMKFWLKA